jgi:acyl carrier protein
MPSFDEIAVFISEYTHTDRSALTEETSLLGDLGVYGLDMYALLVRYSERFGVEISGYRWYFHTSEDGLSIGALFSRPPHKRVKHIPITIGMLHEMAQAGRWTIQYPDHNLPAYRLDVLINAVIFFGALVFVVFALVVAAMGGIQ